MALNIAHPLHNSGGRASRAHRPPSRPLDRHLAVLAGAGLLLIAGLGAFGFVGVVEGLVTDGNAARTAADITGSRGLFALGVCALYVAALLDVLVAWALLRFFEPVDSSLARLSAYLRVAYAAVFLVAISQLASVPEILGHEGGAFSTDQVQAQALGRVEAFHDVWFAGLLLFGAHLAVLGLLVIRSTCAPRIIGVLLVVAGAGYAFDTFYDVLRPDTTMTVSSVTFLGEFLLAVWLVARGGRVAGGGAPVGAVSLPSTPN
jgi:hypothetical protein